MKKRSWKSKVSLLLLCLVFILLFTELASSQEEDIAKYPSRPITFIFPYAAGANLDLAFRLLTKEAEKFLGQPIMVVNKVGGGGTIGVAAVAAAKPDGYTIGQTGGSAMFVEPFFEKVPYHPVKDFRQIIQVVSSSMGLVVRADSPYKRFQDIVEYARKNPKKLTYGTAGAKNMQYFVISQIAKREKVEFALVPFKAGSEAEMALLGGHIQFVAGGYSHSLIEAGKTRLLLLLREERSPLNPEIPILKDIGYDLPCPMYASVACAKGVPDGIVKKLEQAFTEATKQPAFIKGMKDLKADTFYRNGKEMEEYVARNYSFFAELLKEMGPTK